MAEEPFEQAAALQRRLEIAFRDQALLLQALTHRSYLAESVDAASNERLEFLGDAVLDLVIAEMLFRTHPAWPEGELTRAKASVVGERSLAELARAWDLGAAMRISRGEDLSGGRERRALLADAVEAVIGAYFLDQGLEATRDFVLRAFRTLLETIERREHALDYKTQLQELFQSQYQAAPSYAVAEESGPPHDRTFTVEVTFGERVLGRGEGKSKKEAAQRAAEQALHADLAIPPEPADEAMPPTAAPPRDADCG